MTLSKAKITFAAQYILGNVRILTNT